MKNKIILGLCLFLCCAVTPAFSTSKEKGTGRTERFSATLVDVSGPGAGRVRPIDIYIEDYSSDAETNQLAGAFADGGSRALFKVLTKMKTKGRIAPVGRVGYEVRYIRSSQTPNGRKIVMLTDRPIGFLEAYYGTRSRDYQYALIEINIKDDGKKGEGSLIYAAKVKAFTGDTIEVENFGIQPAKLMVVRKL